MLDLISSEASNPTPYTANIPNAVPQIASCVNATSDTPTSLPIINVKGFTDEKRISAMRVSFSSITAPRMIWPYIRIARYITNPMPNTIAKLPPESRSCPVAPILTACRATGSKSFSLVLMSTFASLNRCSRTARSRAAASMRREITSPGLRLKNSASPRSRKSGGRIK